MSGAVAEVLEATLDFQITSMYLAPFLRAEQTRERKPSASVLYLSRAARMSEVFGVT